MFPTTSRRLTGWGRTAPSGGPGAVDPGPGADRQGGRAGRRRRHPRRHRQGTRPVLRGQRPERRRAGRRHDGAQPDPLGRSRKRTRRRRRGREPRSADAGGTAARPLGAGAAGHPPGHRRRGHRLRHPRQESSQRGQLRRPRAVDGAADRRRRDPPPHTGRRRLRVVLGDGRRQRAHRNHPAHHDRDDPDGNRVLHRRRRRHRRPRRDDRIPQRRQRIALHLLQRLVRRHQRATEAGPRGHLPRLAGHRRAAAQEAAGRPAEVRCAAILHRTRHLPQRSREQAHLRGDDRAVVPDGQDLSGQGPEPDAVLPPARHGR